MKEFEEQAREPMNARSAKSSAPSNTLKKILLLVLAIALLVGSVFVVKTCSAPPKYEDIEARFRQLLEDSHEVNVVLFGEGLPVYPHVSDPKSSTEIIRTGEYVTNSKGEEVERMIYYYYTLDSENTVVAYRDSYLEDYAYALVSETELDATALKERFPAKADDTAVYYENIYSNADKKQFCYTIPYTEAHYDFYYAPSDAENYDYVSLETDCRSIDDIKELAESVYSLSYANSIYTTLFDGIASGGVIETAKFIETTASNGTLMLAQSNTCEPMKVEKRVYLFETAKINMLSSNKNLVRISIESYLPSNPDKIIESEITLVYEGGDWFLNNPSF